VNSSQQKKEEKKDEKEKDLKEKNHYYLRDTKLLQQ